MRSAPASMPRALPGTYKVLLTDDAAGTRLREWYDAGVDQILRKPVTDAAVTDVLRRSVPLARLRQRLAREESDRASASWPRRLLHRIWKLGLSIPGRSTILILAMALTLGMLFAVSVNTMSAMVVADARSDPFMDRLLRFSAQEQMLRHWTVQQQVEMGREMNETTRRYYEEQLRNQRWQGLGPRREPAEAPPPRTVVVPVEVPSSAPAPAPSGGRYGTGSYPGNGLPYQ